MQIYGYCRISTPQQNIERQIRNILAMHPTAHIIREVYTGRPIKAAENWINCFTPCKQETLSYLTVYPA